MTAQNPNLEEFDRRLGKNRFPASGAFRPARAPAMLRNDWPA